jgi:type IV pilus assembly protein PilC
MPKFRYKAVNPWGKAVQGTLEAENEENLVATLRKKRLQPVSISRADFLGDLLKSLISRSGKVTTSDVVLFSRQFSTMISAGLPILEGLTILSEESESPGFRKVMRKVRDDISDGVPLSEALSYHPKVFKSLFINMVKAGEQGGILDIIFERLAGYLEKSEGVKTKVKSAMMYPTVVATVAVLVVVFLMVKVIPVFQVIFASFKASLPWPTQMVIRVSEFFTSPNAFLLLLLGAGLGIGLTLYRKTVAGAYRWDALTLKMPIFGVLFQKTALAKFSRTLATLLKSGVPIMDALETVAKASGNLVLEKAVLDARNAVREGKPLAKPLRESWVFPRMVTQMINVGEQTGAMDAMLAKIADFYEAQVDAAVAGLTSIIEPILIVFLGVTVGFIVVAMFLPILLMPTIF